MKASPIKSERLATSLRITHSWRTPAAFGLLAFAIVWNGFIFFFLMAGAGWPVIFHALVGLFLIWYVTALFLNTSVLEATARELRVSHGPVPTWMRNRIIPVTDLRQLYVSQAGTRKSGSQSYALWTLKAELNTGETRVLLKPLREKERVKGIEQELETYLNIRHEDREERLRLPDLGRLKEILPAGIHRHVEKAAPKTRRARQLSGNLNTPRQPNPRSSAPVGPLVFYRTRPGESFCVKGKAYQVVSNLEIEWKDVHHPSAHVLTATGEDGYRRFYTELIRERWTYFEERPLDAGERETLGFTHASVHPCSLRNGEDKYYPGSLHTGSFKEGKQAGAELEQYTYLTTRSATQFRAFRVSGGRWEVCVKEPVDSSYFRRCE